MGRGAAKRAHGGHSGYAFGRDAARFQKLADLQHLGLEETVIGRVERWLCSAKTAIITNIPCCYMESIQRTVYVQITASCVDR